MVTYKELRDSLESTKRKYNLMNVEGAGAPQAKERYKRLAKTAESLRQKLSSMEGPIKGIVSLTLSENDKEYIGANGTTLEGYLRCVGRDVGVRFSLNP